MIPNATPKVNRKPPIYTQDGAIFLPVSVGPDDHTPDQILAWIRTLQPQNDGRLYVRISEVRAAFGAPELFYHVVAVLYREGMAEVERWRLEKLGPRKPKGAPWEQIELVYAIAPIELGRPIFFETYTKQNTEPKPLTKEERLVLWKAYGGACFYCEKPIAIAEMSVDHDLPTSRGGGNDMDNLICSCRPCNTDKNARTSAEYLRLVTERDGV